MEPWTSLLLTLGSIVVGLAAAWFFYHRSRDDARRDRDEARRDAEDARAILQRLMSVLSSTVDGNGHDAATLQVPATTLKPQPGAAFTQLVLASLSVLQDERGQVDRRRLFNEIGDTVGSELLPAAEDVLLELRHRGQVDWQGDDRDLTKIPTLTLRMAARPQ